MQEMSRFAIAIFLFFASAFAVSAERPRPLAWAMDAVRAENWETAAKLAARDGDVAADIIEWHRLRAARGSFADVIAFLDRRPHWPGEPLLRRRSEAVVTEQKDEDILAFFAAFPAQTPEGVLAHANALARSGASADARANIVLAWCAMSMNETTQNEYLKTNGDLLASHHITRLDGLLWSNKTKDARRMLKLVPAGHQALAKARLALQQQSDAVDALIKAVPKALADDPGLAHARFEWRVRKGRWEDAKALLRDRSQSAERLGQPDSWAQRRLGLARDEMRDGSAALAYELAARHFLTEGASYADLEWLAGYIALRKLQDPITALTHFQNHRAAILSPISIGRAAYWIGRTHETLGNGRAAKAAYAEGARYQTSFYGLLATERGGFPMDPDLDGREVFEDWRSSDLVRHDVFEAGMLLQASGELYLAGRFWAHLAEDLDREEAGQLGQAAIDAGQPNMAVRIGKRIAKRGETLHAAYYPLHPLAYANLPMAPEMNLAIARRESEFDPSVQSGAGARGLMQVMPATAKDVAADLGRSAEHSTARLTSDPVYNAELGATFLSQLAGRFGGNVILMSAAYNAGPSRPIRWMTLYGDPRKGSEAYDVVDWIEHIPYGETRNYVMRVAESLPIYRARLGKYPLPIPFSAELAGSTLLSFAPKGE